MHACIRTEIHEYTDNKQHTFPTCTIAFRNNALAVLVNGRVWGMVCHSGQAWFGCAFSYMLCMHTWICEWSVCGTRSTWASCGRWSLSSSILLVSHSPSPSSCGISQVSFHQTHAPHEDIRPYLYAYALCSNVDTCLAYEHTHAHADIWKDGCGQFPNWCRRNRICTDSELWLPKWMRRASPISKLLLPILKNGAFILHHSKLDSNIACSHLCVHAFDITRVTLHLCYVYTRSHPL